MFHLLSILFGGGFTLVAAYGLGGILSHRLAAPPEIRLALGAAAESLVVFLLLLCHAAIWPAFLAVGVCGIAAIWWHRPATEEKLPALPRQVRYAAWAIFAGYGFFYLVNALAPEVQPDGLTYHLGLPYEYVRLGGFPDRARFYDLIPQGMEMLFTMAFVFGRHAAAKLVEFGLSAAAVPLIFRVGRRLGMSDTGSLVVAVFYWTAPLVGLTGASTYNDAAQVFFMLAAFYLLLTWRETDDARYLLPAGRAGRVLLRHQISGHLRRGGSGFVRARVRARPALALRRARGGGNRPGGGTVDGAQCGAHRRPHRSVGEFAVSESVFPPTE